MQVQDTGWREPIFSVVEISGLKWRIEDVEREPDGLVKVTFRRSGHACQKCGLWHAEDER